MANTLVLFNCSPAIVNTIRTGLTEEVETHICGSWDEVRGLVSNGSDCGVITELRPNLEHGTIQTPVIRAINGSLDSSDDLTRVPTDSAELSLQTEAEAASLAAAGGSLSEQVDECERRIIAEMLQRYRNHRNETAAALGISRVTLYNKMKKFGML